MMYLKILSKDFELISHLLKTKKVEFIFFGGIDEKNMLTSLIEIKPEHATYYSLSIPKKIQLQFLVYCKNNNLTPCVLHSHLKVDKLLFSRYDDVFEKQLNIVANKIQCKSSVMLLVGEIDDDIHFVCNSKERGFKNEILASVALEGGFSLYTNKEQLCYTR